MPCRIRALLKEFIHDWDKLNLAAKVLVLFGGFLFVSIIFIAIYHGENAQMKEKIEVIFRSAIASVFGFILSSNTKNAGINKQQNNNLLRSENKEIENNEMSEKSQCDFDASEEDKYYYRDGNSVQILIAMFIAIISGTVILFILIEDIKYDEAILSQFRDFMCTSLGFLIGESKIRT